MRVLRALRTISVLKGESTYFEIFTRKFTRKIKVFTMELSQCGA